VCLKFIVGMHQPPLMCRLALTCALVLLAVSAVSCQNIERRVFIWRDAPLASTTKEFLGVLSRYNPQQILDIDLGFGPSPLSLYVVTSPFGLPLR
jgi:hypothetical protein